MLRTRIRIILFVLGVGAIVLGFIIPWQSVQEMFTRSASDGATSGTLMSNIGNLMFMLTVALGTVCVLLAALWPRLEKAIQWLWALPTWQFMTGLIIIGVVLRLAWIVAMPVAPESDEAIYDGLARNIANGVGFIDNFSPPDFHDAGKLAFRPPGYPYLLAAIYKVFGQDVKWGQAFNLVLSALLIYLTYLLAKLLRGEAVGRLAAVLVAFSPEMIAISAFLAIEVPTAIGLSLALILVIRAAPNWTVKLMVLAGIALGIGAEMNFVIFLVPFPLLIAMWYVGKHFWRALLGFGVMLVTTLLVMLPWAIRNTQVLGSFVLTSTNSGLVMYQGTITTGNGGTVEDDSFASDADRIQFDQLATEIEAKGDVGADAAWKQLAIANIRANPVGWVVYGLTKKMPTLYVFDYVYVARAVSRAKELHNLPGVVSAGLQGITQFYYVLVMIPMLFALLNVRAYRRAPFRLALLLVILYWSGVYFLFIGDSRYHIPLVTVFALLGASALCTLAQLYWRKVSAVEPVLDRNEPALNTA